MQPATTLTELLAQQQHALAGADHPHPHPTDNNFYIHMYSLTVWLIVETVRYVQYRGNRATAPAGTADIGANLPMGLAKHTHTPRAKHKHTNSNTLSNLFWRTNTHTHSQISVYLSFARARLPVLMMMMMSCIFFVIVIEKEKEEKKIARGSSNNNTSHVSSIVKLRLQKPNRTKQKVNER